MKYSETIEFLYHSLPMFSRTGPKNFKPDLKKTFELCEHLGYPQTKFKSVHIAGTNGKGSVSNMMAAIFQEHGYKTGLYTSPHLLDFRERIRINGKMIYKRSVVDFVKRTRSIAEEIKPSFFELTFAMAMDHFANEKIDIAIVETGLGGRLDSTNVIMPELSIITNIGMDHTDVLGNTLDKIAGEKAGIIKRNIPVVIGESHPETKPVFVKKALEQYAPIFFAQEHFDITHSSNNKYLIVADKKSGMHSRYTLDLKGSYQEKNLATVLQSIRLLQEEFNLDGDKVRKALSHIMKSTGLQGRWQIIRKKPLVVLDVAHNADGIRCLVQQVQATPHHKLHIVIGMVKDKDISAVFGLLPKEASYFFTNAHIARAMPAKDFQQMAKSYSLFGKAYDNVNDAAISAMQHATPEDIILVCGSVFVVGEVEVQRLKSAFNSRKY